MFKGKFAVSLTLVSCVCLSALLLGAGIAQAQTINEFNIPTAGSGPFTITAGPDGALWFTESTPGGNNIGRITTAGAITEYAIAAVGCEPYGITAGPDGALWFTEYAGISNRIGRITTAGAITEFAIPTPGSGPYAITAGPDGALWFTEHLSSKIGRITTAGVITEFALPTPWSGPDAITAGPDGALWFTEHFSSKIGRITTAGTITEYAVPTAGSAPGWIATGPDGALWFTEFAGNKIGRITTTGAITEFAVPTAGGQPFGITTGPDGALWFVEDTGNKIGRITTWGAITEYNIPTAGSGSYVITKGPDGADLWFAEYNGNKIGQLVEYPGHTWYLAEGTSAWGFTTYITIENPNNVPVHADINYMTNVGPVAGGTLTLPAASQTTVDPALIVPNRDFSTRVTCTEGRTIAVDRTMTWTGQGATSPEAHNSVGVNSPATTWYLPEGSSAWDFECWLLIQNPNPTAATCQVTYMIEGAAAQTFTKTVPANSRQTYNMETDIGQRDASIRVESNVPVIPERAMYRHDRREGHDSIGTTYPNSDYYLAEGATAWGFNTYVLVQNPNATATDVTITYMTPTGAVQYPTFSMPANSRRTVLSNDFIPDRDLSTHVHGSQPIIAERAMYWEGDEAQVCHDSIGMAMPHTYFYLPDGQTGAGYETWTLVQNPNPEAVQVEITYMTPTGIGNQTFTDTVGANSRKTYDMSQRIAAGRAGVYVRCTTPGRKIMCERAMYWNNRGAGTDTIGGYSN